MVKEAYNKIKELISEMEVDVYKFEDKNNKSAGQRIRKNLQEVKQLSQEIRMHILEKRKK